MDLNIVEIISDGDQTRLFIDGLEIKVVQGINIQREVGHLNTKVELKLICDLKTREEQSKKDEYANREVKVSLSEKAEETTNYLLKNLNPKEALAVLKMAKVLVEIYNGF